MGNWDIALIALLVLAYAAVSRRLERSPISAPIVFTTAGLVLGGEALGWLELPFTSEALRTLAEATLALVLFSDASRIDLAALRRELGLPVRLLGIGLPLTIAVGTVLAVGLFGQLSWAEALVVAVILAPTDAALGQAVVVDPRVPMRVRQALNVESGLNDGICVPLLFIALALEEAETGEAGPLRLVLEEIGWGVAAGAAAGALTALALNVALRRGLVAAHWQKVVPLAGAALAYGSAAALGGSGFIAAFVGGVLFGLLERPRDEEATALVEQVGQVLNAVTFILFAAVALPRVLDAVDWRIVLYAVLSLTVARMLPVALALLGSHARRQTVGYLGWFGPRGLASIVFAVIVLDDGGLPHEGLVITTILVTVALSVYAHGLSALPLTDRYARWYASHPVPPRLESGPAHRHRPRLPFPS